MTHEWTTASVNARPRAASDYHADLAQEPSPYELYVRLASLCALWPRKGLAAQWPGSIVVSCGSQAAELCLRLIEDALPDRRGPASCELRVERFVEHLSNGQRLVSRLLARTPPPPAALLRVHSERAHSPGFSAIARLTTLQLDSLTIAFEQQTKSLPFQFGIEHLLASAREAHGLAPLAGLRDDPARPALDYLNLVLPEIVWNLREPQPFGPEDHLFSTAHQISECWLAIAHDRLQRAREADAWPEAAHLLAEAASVITLVIEAGQLLDLMVLSDYHPLRVRLRDGSGAQSRAAQQLAPLAHEAAQRLWAALSERGLSLLELLERPAEQLELHRYLQALKLLGKQIQSFLFQHYLLALGVLGTQSLGSLGYSMHKLAERAAKPIFPRINQGHHDYVMLTNFRHGASSGAIIYKNERAAGYDPYQSDHTPTLCPAPLIARQVLHYFACISARDADGWVALFEPTRGTLHDVDGTRPYLGAERLRIFIHGMFNAFSEMHGTTSGLAIDGNRASIDWHFEAVSYFGLKTAFSGREEFLFDAHGVILEATAHWNPSDVSRQWETRLT